jgi:hypothetical protein
MKRTTQSLRLFAVEHLNAKTLRVAAVLLTLVTVILSAGAPIGGGGPNGR